MALVLLFYFTFLLLFLQSCSRYGVGENEFGAGKVVFSARVPSFFIRLKCMPA